MSFLGGIDAELQKELLAFVEAETQSKDPKPLKDSLAAEILRQIIKGDRQITGMATNHDTGDVFVRFSFTE